MARFETKSTPIVGGGAVERPPREMGVAATEINRGEIRADQTGPASSMPSAVPKSPPRAAASARWR